MDEFDAIAFQPTLPARGATSDGSLIPYAFSFQPTLPARGATTKYSGNFFSVSIGRFPLCKKDFVMCCFAKNHPKSGANRLEFFRALVVRTMQVLYNKRIIGVVSGLNAEVLNLVFIMIPKQIEAQTVLLRINESTEFRL